MKVIGRCLRGQHRRGLTLIECVIALVIMSLVVTAIAYGVTSGQMMSFESLRQSQAAMLAEALMDEILVKTYSAPVNGSALARTARGQVGQYNGFTEAVGALSDAAGTAYPSDLQLFSRTATVASATVTLAGLTATTGVQITVTVSKDGRALSTLTRFMVKP